MAYYPVLLDLSGKKVIIIGGGKVAQRKIETLLSYGAVIHVISKDLTPELKSLLEKGDIKLLGDEFDESFIKDAFLLIVATNDKTLNRKVSSIAREKNILVNTVDQPEECSFIVPSIIKRDDLIVAISTSGKSPALAKRIRETLEGQFGDEYGSFLSLMGKIRKELVSSGMPEDDRNKIFHNLVDSPILKLLRARDMAAAAEEMQRILKREFSSDDVFQYIKDE
jgi:precorrin-2 dehydrogenase / sirohydrochlorin ferrochelatase